MCRFLLSLCVFVRSILISIAISNSTCFSIINVHLMINLMNFQLFTRPLPTTGILVVFMEGSCIFKSKCFKGLSKKLHHAFNSTKFRLMFPFTTLLYNCCKCWCKHRSPRLICMLESFSIGRVKMISLYGRF